MTDMKLRGGSGPVEEEANVKAAKKLPQVSVAVIATLGSFLCGTALAWSAPAVPSLQEGLCEPDCDIPNITEEDTSWIGALMPAGAVFSGFVAGWLLGRVGRRWTMVICSVPFLVGSVLFVVAYHIQNEVPLYFGRVLTGFSGGAFLLVAPLYIVEVSEPSLRGALASISQLMLTLGIAYDNALSINGVLGWNVISGILIAVPIVICAGMVLVPESPMYLLEKDRQSKALEALVWLRGDAVTARRDLDLIIDAKATADEAGSVSVATLVTVGRYARPFAVVMTLMFLQQFCGVNVVTFYQQEIFIDAGSELDPGLNATLVSAAQIVGNLLAILVVERVGRKILLATSSLLMGLSITCLGVFFYLKENQEVICPDVPEDVSCVPQSGKFESDLVDDLGWLPVTSLMVYMVAFAIGMGPLPWAVNAEVFLPEARSLAASLAGAFNWLCAFFVTKFQSDLEDALGTYGTYFLFGSICVAGAVFVVVAVPETKAKTLGKRTIKD